MSLQDTYFWSNFSIQFKFVEYAKLFFLCGNLAKQTSRLNYLKSKNVKIHTKTTVTAISVLIKLIFVFIPDN